MHTSIACSCEQTANVSGDPRIWPMGGTVGENDNVRKKILRPHPLFAIGVH